MLEPAGLIPAILVLLVERGKKTWMPVTGAA
jgi:hypothetical protein